jgi:hypothetical protein
MCGLAPRIIYLEGEVLEEEGVDLPEKPRKPARSPRLHECLCAASEFWQSKNATTNTH